jgi:hypothetical protein
MSKTMIAGWVCSALMGGMMLFAGAGKVLGFAPEMVTTNFENLGMTEQLKMVGGIEMVCAIFFLIPRTLPFGLLLSCSFWGGAIVFHLALGDGGYIPALVLGALGWAGAYLRRPQTLYMEGTTVEEPAAAE